MSLVNVGVAARNQCCRGNQAHRSKRNLTTFRGDNACIHNSLKFRCGAKEFRCGANSRLERCGANSRRDGCLAPHPSARA